jgi:AraC-like DNA-binding protein
MPRQDHPAEPVVVRLQPGASEAPKQGTDTVLWIDGDFSTTTAPAEDLRRFGVQVDTAVFASSGIALAAQSAYSLILVDGRLPDATTTSVLEALHNLGVDTPVVIVSTPVSVETAVAFMRLGALDIALKPISAPELLHRVRQHCDRQSPADHCGARPRRQRDVVSEVTRALLSHPAISLPQASRAVGLERHVVERCIRAETGRSYREWRQQVVAHSAARVLRSSTLPIKAIAYELGYRSVRAFARAFRTVQGVSPSTYRRCTGLQSSTREQYGEMGASGATNDPFSRQKGSPICLECRRSLP